jgi:hypothetical protein
MAESRETNSRALLPWAVNGTLNEDEQAQVEQLLQTDEQARQELAYLQRLAREVKEDAPPGIASELGWQRFKRQLDQKPEDATSRLPRKRLGSLLAVAAALVITVQFGWMLKMHTDNSELNLELLAESGLAGEEDRLLLQVMFEPTVQIADINALLQQLDARIIAGPSPLGLYKVSIPRVDEDQTAELLEQLLARSAIRHVEQADLR